MSELPILRTSERSSFKRCVQQWQYGYRMGLKPRKADSGARWFGTGIHLCLAEWYILGKERGRDPRDTWEEFTKDSYESIMTMDVDGEKEWHDAKALGMAMLDNYLEEYGTDDQWEVISPEQRFGVLIPHPANKDKALIDYRGTFDMVVRDHSDGKIKLLDHKTAAAIMTNHLVLDDQAGGYIAVATSSLRAEGLIKPREYVHGMLYNFLRKGMPDTRPRSEKGYHNKPTKAHYVDALVEQSVQNGDFADQADDQNLAVIQIEHYERKRLMKLKLDELAMEASDRSLTVFGDVSKVQPPPLLLRHWEPRTTKERNNQIKKIGEEALVMDAFRNHELPIIKSTTRECTWCDFFELCTIDEAGGDVELMMERAYEVKDPYFDHRIGAENSKESVSNDQRLRVVK